MNGFLSMQAEFGMVAAIVVMLLADLILKRPNHKPLQTLAVVLTLALTVLCLTEPAGEAFGGMYVNTSIASAVKAILTAGTLLVFTLAGRWLEREDTAHKAGEFYTLTLCTLFGMYLMVSSGSFLTFYIGLETASIPMACLVALDKWRRQSAEAGAKFILSSMFSSALMLYGVSMLYGTSGTAYFVDAAAMLTGTPLQIAAMVFFFAGLGFKLSLVPFHAWTPDTYQGAPTPVTGYLSVVSKGAAAFALTAILMKVFGQMVEDWSLMLGIVIVVTITVANLFAVLQKDMKRFMAYSSISQAGYLVLGTLAGSGQGMASLVYYLAVYVVANLAIFGIIGIVEQQTGRTGRDAYNGFYRTNPHLTFIMTLALFSLGGIPPFAGFFSKFFVFASAFHTGHWLVVFLALVNTIISLYYYLLVVKAMFITQTDSPAPAFKSPALARTGLVICLAGILVLGICSGVYDWLTELSMQF